MVDAWTGLAATGGNFGPGYSEGALFLRAIHAVTEGNFFLAIHLDDDMAMAVRGEIFGLPNELGRIGFAVGGNKAKRSVDRFDTRLLGLRAPLGEELATAAFSIPGLPDRIGGSVIDGLSNLYFDVAMSATEYALPSLLRLARPKRILLGTDYLYMLRAGVVGAMSGLTKQDGIDADVLSAVASQNARQLFPKLAKAASVGATSE